jgi:hypothetical protein
MRHPAIFLGLCLIAMASSPLVAQVSAANEPDRAKIPPVILEGLHQLANQKLHEAEKAWFRGSPPEGQPVSDELRSLLENYGVYQNFDVVSVQDITPRMRVIYLVLNFERPPDIVKFVTYKTTDGWILLYRKIDIDEKLFEPVAVVRQ